MPLSPSPQYLSLTISNLSFLSPLNTAAHLLAFSTPSSFSAIHTYIPHLFLLSLITLKLKLRSPTIMSSRRSRSGGISDDQIADLIRKLHQLVPELRRTRSSHKATASKVLQETCNYIRSLHREVDDLSDRLSELLASTDTDSAQAAIIRTLLM